MEPDGRVGIRIEHDLIGDQPVPVDARYGIHTERALQNFRQSRPWAIGEVPEFARAYGFVKLAALQANVQCGVLDGPMASALEQACWDLIEDRAGLRSELIVPLVQGGAGTSTNMNVNEVLANRALEIMGRPHGDYASCHPNDHVNRSQSTNDTYPTALHLALMMRGSRLLQECGLLVEALREKGAEYEDVMKLGRTQLQDAVPIPVSAEFDAWADAHESAANGVRRALSQLRIVNLGGTAIGTGLAAPEGFAELAVRRLSALSSVSLTSAPPRVSATTDSVALLDVSASLRNLAIVAAKLANDLRLLGSGPRAGLGEVRLPAVQSGSSMMPGKVNPVIPEYVNQVAFRVRGADLTVSLALDAGQLQLHAMLPIVAHELFGAQAELADALGLMRRYCIAGLEIDRGRVEEASALGLGELSELAATGGYAAATRLAVESGRSMVQGR